MSKLFGLLLAISAATLVYSAAALGYTPQPHTFAFQTTIQPFGACVVPEQNYAVKITVTNISKTLATAKVSTDPMGISPYQFGYVSTQPRASSATTSYSDPNGNSYSYKVYSWQRRLKPGKSATFSIVAKAPNWNYPVQSYTDPNTGTVYPAPTPEPYPASFGFLTEAIGDTGAGQFSSLRLSYCGQPVPDLGPGAGKG